MSKKPLANLPVVKIKARTENQKRFIHAVNSKDFVILEGALPGCGKSFLSIGLACQMLASGKIEKIVLAQHTQHMSRNMGYTSGSFREKCLDYFDQQVEYFEQFITPKCFKDCWDNRIIEITATELLRGRNFENTFVILDEAQNCTKHDILTFVSRISVGSKAIIIGDRLQADNKNNIFGKMVDQLEDEDLSIMVFDERDVCRHNKMAKIYYKICGIE